MDDPRTFVLAHAFGDRYELPLPLLLFVAGGALVVAASFAVLAWRRPDAGADGAEPVRDLPDELPERRPGRWASVIAIAATLAVATVGITGTQETSANLAPTVFWVLFWIGVPLLCGVLGDWTRTVNPFAAVAALTDNSRLRQQVLARSRPLTWSDRVGTWPAVAMFLALILGELVFQLDATRPGFVGQLLLLYLLLSAALGLLFGRSWVARGEVFSQLFDAWGRLGFFRFGAPGRRGFAGGLDVPFRVTADRVVFVMLMLISINFDGLLATPQWARFELRTFGTDVTALHWLRVGSLAAVMLLVLGLFAVFAVASCRLGRFSRGALPDLAVLLPSLLPIAYGYLVAHYLQYLLTNGQLLIPQLGNPGYDDWPITLPRPFRSDYVVDTALLPNSFYWYFSVAVIVLVHIVAVVVASRALGRRAGDRRSGHRSEYPWLVAMVGYTALSLFLIAQPLTVPPSEQGSVVPSAGSVPLAASVRG